MPISTAVELPTSGAAKAELETKNKFENLKTRVPRYITYNRVDNDNASLCLLIAAIKPGETEVYRSLERLIRMETLLITVVAVHTSKETTLCSKPSQISFVHLNCPQSWAVDIKWNKIPSVVKLGAL